MLIGLKVACVYICKMKALSIPLRIDFLKIRTTSDEGKMYAIEGRNMRTVRS